MFPSRPPRFLVNHKELLFQLERRVGRQSLAGGDLDQVGRSVCARKGGFRRRKIAVIPVTADAKIKKIVSTSPSEPSGFLPPSRFDEIGFPNFRVGAPSTVNLRNGID